MALWDWAVGAYARPGVSQACLRLQDEFGQNVSFLLWAAWARPQDPQLLARGAAVARAWEEAVLQPLRASRRALKPARPPVADAARERLREEVKAAELHAERILTETLETVGAAPRGAGSAADALAAASRAWGGAPPPLQALAALAEALA